MAELFCSTVRFKQLDASRPYAQNAGKLWTTDELVKLVNLFAQGYGVGSICAKLERTVLGVLMKLKERGLVTQDSSGDWRYITEPHFTGKIANVVVVGDNVAPTSQKENQMSISNANIENVTMIQGQNAAQMTDDDIFQLIAKLEKEVETLSLIIHRPIKLSAKINKLNEDIKDLVMYVDSRA
jgi:hypothetical protein